MVGLGLVGARGVGGWVEISHGVGSDGRAVDDERSGELEAAKCQRQGNGRFVWMKMD